LKNFKEDQLDLVHEKRLRKPKAIESDYISGDTDDLINTHEAMNGHKKGNGAANSSTTLGAPKKI